MINTENPGGGNDNEAVARESSVTQWKAVGLQSQI